VTANTVDKEDDRGVVEYGENKATQVMFNYFFYWQLFNVKNYILCLICCILLWFVAVYYAVTFIEW